ncbi:hypothetical protein BKA70DRAFT_1239619 [Coprinopsis sp. MPI-PUGE-AT-0042]|nr:hypothetical protein BKA70DRAFT_1239619 [Coprinopsis sp. MPI-PUGE-AT-0042]
MAQRRQGKRGTIRNRNVIQGSNGFTINGGTYANGDAPTTTQYNLLAINVSGSPSLFDSNNTSRLVSNGDYLVFIWSRPVVTYIIDDVLFIYASIPRTYWFTLVP